MKHKAIKIAGALLLLVLALWGVIETRGTRVFPEPLPQLHASTDPQLIARGRHLFQGPAYCIGCHGAQGAEGGAATAVGTDALPTGGWQLSLLPGVFRAPNLTSHEHGLKLVSDGQIARMLRTGIRADGQLSVPIMQYENLSDGDVVALLSYLRSLPPVEHAVQKSELNLLGKALIAFGVLSPQRPFDKIPPVNGVALADGRYLAVDVANCQGCHTERDPTSGKYVGPLLAGGLRLQGSDGRSFVSPDITLGGVLRDMSSEAFIARMRAGAADAASPMPWAALGRSSDHELSAIYDYLRSVPPSGRAD